MEHNEVRFRILHTLYQKHYSDQLGHPQQTDKVIAESGLLEVSKIDVYADIVYLKDKALIKGQSALGYSYPPWITITSYGIDTVENGYNNFINNLDLESFEPQVKSDIERVLKLDKSTSAKIDAMFYLLRQHNQLTLLINEIAKLASGYRY